MRVCMFRNIGLNIVEYYDVTNIALTNGNYIITNPSGTFTYSAADWYCKIIS